VTRDDVANVIEEFVRTQNAVSPDASASSRTLPTPPRSEAAYNSAHSQPPRAVA
jgi:hypothetical protein